MFDAARTKFFRNLTLETFHRGRRGTLRIMMPGKAERLFGGLDKEVHAEMTIKNDAFYSRWVLYGSIGLAESYLRGEWETSRLTNVIAWFFLNNDLFLGQKSEQEGIEKHNLLGVVNRLQHFLRARSKTKSGKAPISDRTNNNFFKEWLDVTMGYSAGYYQTPHDTLETAQANKWDLICKKLQLHAHDYVLDLGCGWGGFAIHAAQKYGCRVHATTISEEEFREAAKRVADAGVSDLVEVALCDYHYLSGRFDKIACIEMLDAIGDSLMETFFSKLETLLAPQGLLFFQTTLCPDNNYPSVRDSVDFVQKYIVPGSLTMSLRRITEACNSTSDFNLLEYEDITASAVRSLIAWREGFVRTLPKLQKQGYDTLFLRTWFYYLCYLEAALSTRSRNVAQLLYTRPRNLTLKSAIYSFSEEILTPVQNTDRKNTHDQATVNLRENEIKKSEQIDAKVEHRDSSPHSNNRLHRPTHEE